MTAQLDFSARGFKIHINPLLQINHSLSDPRWLHEERSLLMPSKDPACEFRDHMWSSCAESGVIWLSEDTEHVSPKIFQPTRFKWSAPDYLNQVCWFAGPVGCPWAWRWPSWCGWQAETDDFSRFHRDSRIIAADNINFTQKPQNLNILWVV